MQSTAEYAAMPDWLRLSGMTRTGTYMALSRGELRAKKCGRRVLIHVRTGLDYLDNLPDAAINLKSAFAA